MLLVQDRPIERALIVDDEPEARTSYEYLIEDMGIKPHQVTQGLHENLQPFLSSIRPNDVILCDFHLKKHSYAPCNGDQLLARCFRAGFAGVLYTSLSEPPIRRDHLRYIPGLVRTLYLSPDDLLRAWLRCWQEMDGDFEPARRGWRTLVRIDSVEREHRCFYAVVPSWNVRRKVRIYFDNLPGGVQRLIEPNRQLHAVVNTGAERARDLFFDSWEPR